MDIKDLAIKLVPYIAQYIVQIPIIRGDSSRIKRSKNSIINNAVLNTNSGYITIEDDVFFGLYVSLITGTHDINKKGKERLKSFPKTGRDIVIKSGVWLASNVTVLGPCEIGENSVVGANSLVIEDVPANCVYAGSPAKFIKKID
jgi:acetyltransferase-like isoleucine patch superfamily enzyme